MKKITPLLFGSVLALAIAPAAFLKTSSSKESVEAKTRNLPPITDSIQLKTSTSEWVNLTSPYVHVELDVLSFDENETDAIAMYDQELKTFTIYDTESSSLISGIKASGSFDFKVDFEKSFDEDHPICFELDCNSAELTSSSYKTVTVSYLTTENLTISGKLKFNATFYKESSPAYAYFDQEIDPPHYSIVKASSFNLVDDASFDGSTVYNMTAVSGLLSPGYFSLFNLGAMKIDTEGYCKIGPGAASDYPTDYAYTLNISEMPNLIKCGQNFYLTGKSSKVCNSNEFNNEIGSTNKRSTYYVNFRHSTILNASKGVHEVSFIQLVHSTNIAEDKIILWNGNVEKNYSNYHPIGLTYENGVVTFAAGCTYNGPIEVKVDGNKNFDLTVRFESGTYGNTSTAYNRLAILNQFGSVILTTTGNDAVNFNVSSIACTGSLIIKGNLDVNLVGIPIYDGSYPYSFNRTTGYIYSYGFIYGKEKVIIGDNASLNTLTASLNSPTGMKSNIVYTSRLIVTTSKSVVIGATVAGSNTLRINGVNLLDDDTKYEIDDKRLIRNQPDVAGATFKFVRYKGDYNYFAGSTTYTVTSSSLPGRAQQTNTEIEIADDPDSSNIEIATFTSNSGYDLANQTISFEPNGGTGSMASIEHYTAHTFYKLPDCGFGAPSGKMFAGWKFTDKNPSIVKQPGELVAVHDDDLELFPVWEDAPIGALTGTVSITGVLKFNETLTASVSDTNNSGTLSYKWRRNGDDITGATNSTYVVTADDIGYTLSVLVTSSIETGSLVGTTSDVIGKADALAPTGITATACTSDSNDDGTLVGITTAMEYKLSSAADYTSGTGETITGLAPGTYNVRYKATSTHNASAVANVVVNSYNAPVLYAVTVNYGTATPVSATEGTPITIVANAPEEGKVFAGWTSESGVTFADASASTTSFIMIGSDVTVTATYQNEADPVDPVTPDPETPSPETTKKGLSAGAIVAIVLGSVVLVGVGGFAVYWFVFKKKTFQDLIAVFKKK